MISLIFVFAFIRSAAVFRFGFGRLSYRISHRGKTAIALISQIISATLKLVQSSRGSMAVAEPVEATNVLSMISLNSAMASINSATSFRFGFGLRQAQPPHQPPRETASSPIFSIISATLKLVQSSRGSMAVAEPVEATNLLSKISPNSAKASINSATFFRSGFDNFGKLSYRSHRGKQLHC